MEKGNIPECYRSPEHYGYKKQIQGSGFKYTSDDYYETQVIRLGYSYKF